MAESLVGPMIPVLAVQLVVPTEEQMVALKGNLKGNLKAVMMVVRMVDCSAVAKVEMKVSKKAGQLDWMMVVMLAAQKDDY